MFTYLNIDEFTLLHFWLCQKKRGIMKTNCLGLVMNRISPVVPDMITADIFIPSLIPKTVVAPYT